MNKELISGIAQGLMLIGIVTVVPLFILLAVYL